MDLSTDHIASVVVGVAGGGGSIGLLARNLIQNWIRNHDKRQDEVGKGIQAMAIEMAKVVVKMESFEKIAEKVMRQGEDVAVLKETMKVVKDNINGIGAKLRSMS